MVMKRCTERGISFFEGYLLLYKLGPVSHLQTLRGDIFIFKIAPVGSYGSARTTKFFPDKACINTMSM